MKLRKLSPSAPEFATRVSARSWGNSRTEADRPVATVASIRKAEASSRPFSTLRARSIRNSFRYMTLHTLSPRPRAPVTAPRSPLSPGPLNFELNQARGRLAFPKRRRRHFDCMRRLCGLLADLDHHGYLAHRVLDSNGRRVQRHSRRHT